MSAEPAQTVRNSEQEIEAVLEQLCAGDDAPRLRKNEHYSQRFVAEADISDVDDEDEDEDTVVMKPAIMLSPIGHEHATPLFSIAPANDIGPRATEPRNVAPLLISNRASSALSVELVVLALVAFALFLGGLYASFAVGRG